MNHEFKDNSIIILDDNIKLDFIEDFRKTNSFKNIKIFGLNEFQKKFYFNYTKKTVFYIHEKYHCIKDIATIYLKSLYYVKPINNKSVEFLLDLKQDLENQKLLEKDEMFRDYLKDKSIYIYNLTHLDKYYELMFKELSTIANIEYINDDARKESPKPLYALKNKELEVEFVANSIAKLLQDGIDINKIKLANVNENYTTILKRVFKDYNIPIELPTNETIASTHIVKKFIELWQDDLNSALDKLKEQVKTKRETNIYKSIIDVLNEYYWCEDINSMKDYIIDDINRISTPKTILKNAIKCINFTSYNIKSDEYVFLINFNQGVFPKTVSDEDFLNDATKLELGISDSIDINKKTITKIRKKILQTENLIVSYAKNSINGELYISPAYDKNIFIDKIYERTFTHSNAYNLKELLKEKDENRKYGTTNEIFKSLNHHYKDAPYLTYDNTFKGVDKKEVMRLIGNELTLSYSKMNTYYQCGFRYYLDNILKMNTSEDTFEIVIGNIFHRVLSFAFNENFNFENCWNKALSESTIPFGPKENFFLTILKEELKFIIDSINEGMEYTSLKNALYEQKIVIPVGDDGKVVFKGFVDKILYGNIDGKDIAVIIDYKTGTPELKLDNAKYGLDMQLPVYAYLINNYEPLKNAEIGGFYLQKILSNKFTLESKKDALKLQGYTNNDTSITKYVDSSYENSKIIKSLKTGPNGFYSYSKVLSTEEIEDLKGIVKEKIEAAAQDIKNAKFDINPKEIDGKNVGCKFCKYKSICYVKQENIVKIKTEKNKDGGEENA